MDIEYSLKRINHHINMLKIDVQLDKNIFSNTEIDTLNHKIDEFQQFLNKFYLQKKQN